VYLHEVDGAFDVARRDRPVQPAQRVAVIVRLRQQWRGDNELLEGALDLWIQKHRIIVFEIGHRHPYVTRDTTAMSAREIDRRRGFPASKITEVKRVIDPTTAANGASG
jgi:hypothetical protein